LPERTLCQDGRGGQEGAPAASAEAASALPKRARAGVGPREQ